MFFASKIFFVNLIFFVIDLYNDVLRLTVEDLKCHNVIYNH